MARVKFKARGYPDPAMTPANRTVVTNIANGTTPLTSVAQMRGALQAMAAAMLSTDDTFVTQRAHRVTTAQATKAAH